MRKRNKVVGVGVAALTTAAAVGAIKLSNRKLTGVIIMITPGKEMARGDTVEVRDNKSRTQKTTKLSIPLGTAGDFKVGETVLYRVDRNPRHKIDGLPPGSLYKIN